MKLDRSNKFDFCYYGQVNTFGGNNYFAGDGVFHIDGNYSFVLLCIAWLLPMHLPCND